MVCSQFVTVLLIAITVSIVGSPTGSDNVVPCRIPNETDDGTCVDLKKCPAFQKINHVEMMANTSRVSFIRELQCGDDEQVMICCPQSIDSYRKPWISMDVEPRVRFGIRTRTSVGHLGDADDNECGLVTFGNRILRGNIAQIDEFPWAALLKYNKRFPGCGAVLISRNFVITAAHCLIGGEYNTYGPLELVRLREYNLLEDRDCEVQEEMLDCIHEGKLDKKPLAIIVHPDYQESSADHYHDIGLIEIDLTEEFSDFLRPICLPEQGRLTGLKRDCILTVCGWGWTDFFQDRNGNALSPIKMKAKLPFVEQSECQKNFTGYQLISGQICAGGRWQDSCNGDSGSPLMYFDWKNGVWVLSGIVSIGRKDCGTVGSPGIYTSVVEYLPWIKLAQIQRNE
ncbi:CLIP domain-containing serine protease B8-like isoform X2 [Culex pipiens pallens]|uniref:CLIP domain-containing serine protease B8-like isoform X2 n=1 Tax=Culex pipiens pallens TaxID=42434 RepID=UPI001954C15A|nr:CLIP domain-containing serine protease B8-like isoform X2 [Culex pipiens pallens]